MPKAPRIFVVEDDESIRMLLEVALRSSGYTVSAFPNAADALAEMENTVPDAAVLDIMLDGMDGITALKLMRANARLAGVPVMMLTAKDSENDKIIGLDAGADDYMTKPYNPALLLLKIEAIFRRIQPKSSEEETEYQGVRLNLLRSTVEYGEKEVVLSKNEMSILHYLMKHRGKIVSRDELMDYLWDCNDFVDDNTLTVNINRLRRRMEEAGISGMIETRRRQGYILV